MRVLNLIAGDGEWSEGFDTIENLNLLPGNYNGYVAFSDHTRRKAFHHKVVFWWRLTFRCFRDFALLTKTCVRPESVFLAPKHERTELRLFGAFSLLQ
ncbi:hypothetical protein BSK56_07205 [Paenibacillus borealis]|uniref:Uncharacterized protein n=1 Tax=Paenibacillus borealis TaxID=160799 RepID=A0ABX3HMF0_PAEBO|nr:hypothetical protein BSK56_07205 [Paenibacillus borealis]